MTSESDSTSRRRPPTIDLTATEVEADRAAAGQASAAKPAEPRAASGATGRRMLPVMAALAGALAMIAIFGGLWLAGTLPTRDTAVQPAAQVPQPTAADQIAARLDKIQSALQGQQPQAQLASRMAATEAETKSLQESLAALTSHVEAVAAAEQSAAGQAKDALAAADQARSAAQAAAQRSDLDALASRIAALEAAVKALSADVANRAASADDRTARLTVAAEALRASVEREAPYQAELAAVKSLGVSSDTTAPLEQFAASGIPHVTALAHELSALTPALLRASGDAQSEPTYLGRLEASAQNLVRVAPVDAPAGDDPPAILARIDGDAARADIAGALADIARLPDPAKTLAAAWIAKAQARDAAIAASRRIAADALATLVKPASQ
jgi:hypothetical protein